MEIQQKLSNKKSKSKKIGLYCVLVLIILGLGSIFYVDLMLKKIATSYLSNLIGSKVEIYFLSVNLIGQNISVRGLRVLNPEGYSNSGALIVEDIVINTNPWKFFSENIEIKSVALQKVAVKYELSFHGSNWNKIVDNISLSAKRDNSKNTKEFGNISLERSSRKWKINKFIVEEPSLIVTFNQKSIAELKLTKLEVSPLNENALSSKELIEKLVSVLQYQLLHNKIETDIPQVIKDTSEKINQKIKEIF